MSRIQRQRIDNEEGEHDPTQCEEKEEGKCEPTQRDEGDGGDSNYHEEEEEGECDPTSTSTKVAHRRRANKWTREPGYVGICPLFFFCNYLYLGPTLYVWDLNIFFSAHKLFMKEHGFI